METNLDSLFKTDSKLEQEGIWLDITADTGFHVRRFGGENNPKVKAALARHYKPFARLIENDTMSEKDQRAIMVKVFVESSMIGWKGVDMGTEKNVPYSQDAAIKLFIALPILFDTVHKHATDFASFKEDLGNS